MNEELKKYKKEAKKSRWIEEWRSQEWRSQEAKNEEAKKNSKNQEEPQEPHTRSTSNTS